MQAGSSCIAAKLVNSGAASVCVCVCVCVSDGGIRMCILTVEFGKEKKVRVT